MQGNRPVASPGGVERKREEEEERENEKISHLRGAFNGKQKNSPASTSKTLPRKRKQDKSEACGLRVME